MTEKTHQEKAAFIRDGALVLYFDMAEKPVLARFDLDTLAQASFEVSAKDKDGFYTIMLHDFSGDPQPVAQFASKGDAHQALYAILQALLSQKEQARSRHAHIAGQAHQAGSRWGRFLKEFLKTVLYLLTFAFLVYAALFIYYGYIVQKSPSDAASDSAAGTISDTRPQDPAAQQSNIPEGEVLSAEQFLSTLTGDQPSSP